MGLSRSLRSLAVLSGARMSGEAARKVAPAPVSSRFLCPRPPLLFSALNQNRHATQATIPDKTTWESFPHHVHFPTQQNYFQNDAFTERKPLFNVASHKRPEIRLSFEYTTTLLSGEGGEGRTGTATMFRKMLSNYTIFSTVLSNIVAFTRISRAVLSQFCVELIT